MILQSRYAIACAITFNLMQLASGNVVLALNETSPSALVVKASKDQMIDSNLPGGEAVNKILARVQDELDTRTLSKKSQEELEELVQKYPGNYKVHLYLGLVLDEVGLPDQAMSEYETADKLGPHDPRATAGIMNHVLAHRDPNGASALLDKALKRFPDSPEILFYMGKNFKENKHWFEAQRVLTRAYNSGYKIKHLAAELAEIFQTEDPPKALRLANEELAQYPDFHLALQVKAIALMNLGQYNQAIAPLKKLYDQSPSFNRSAEYYLRCLYWAGRYREALQPGFYFLGKEAQYVGTPLISVEVMTKIIRSLPRPYVEEQLALFYQNLTKSKLEVKPAFHYYLASIFYNTGNARMCKIELDKFLQADPKSVEGVYLAGKFAEHYAHDYKEALHYYETARALSPNVLDIERDYTRMEEKQSAASSDWAGAFRDWLSKLFNPANAI